ncbi:microsomal epoxide hydrolase [Exophiala aquamarina CBS 119918]|uniref:Microsomal epoxide hydrolase n=1 Tax=Exophiala aquamarina CBS 119918 TaxID=1182545 RepID=A0A072Q4M6_9EURO|nr:microsomal epoxide hydrolase [Exophiala aquamarina CBS 119918]KEF62850.1 microsomal epoxide hydrolase [Exophiala aquamarina CBS 119918]
MSSSIEPYHISIPESRIADLNNKLHQAHFPDELEAAEWDLGAPLADVKRLTEYWRDEFSWQKAEKKLNQLPHFVTSIQCEGYENLKIHFLHKKSNIKGAVPLLFVHGWPGNFLEATKIMESLTNPGEGQIAFDLVAPSLPNYGFSEGTKKRGFSMDQYAETCHKLMVRLGYNQYVTQGGDWGYNITRSLSILYPDHARATHFNMDVGKAPEFLKNPLLAAENALKPLSQREKDGIARSEWFMKEGFGYNLLQRTKPQTIGYALADSPVALLAWIYEKLHDWTDSYAWTDEEVCTWISIYWFSTAGPAANVRIYYECFRSGFWGQRLSRDQILQWQSTVKIGISHFPRDISVLRSTWTRTVGNCVFERDHPTGGHFAAWERPRELVGDLREMFGKGGGAYKVVEGKSGYGPLTSQL